MGCPGGGQEIFSWKNSALEMLSIMKTLPPDHRSMARREMALIIKREKSAEGFGYIHGSSDRA